MPWKIESHDKVFTISQEYSIINEATLSYGVQSDENDEDEYYVRLLSSGAAAIAIPPYVRDRSFQKLNPVCGPTTTAMPSQTTVTYRDFDKFEIVDENGVTYVLVAP